MYVCVHMTYIQVITIVHILIFKIEYLYTNGCVNLPGTVHSTGQVLIYTEYLEVGKMYVCIYLNCLLLSGRYRYL